MREEEAIKKYIEFYSNESNLNLIFASAGLQYKEFALYNKNFKDYQMKRHFSVSNIEFFKDVIRFNCISWCKRGINKMYNLYYTMATYKEPYPRMVYLQAHRHLRWGFDEMLTKIEFIPLVIDVDSDLLEHLKIHAEDVYKICQRLESPEVVFSGMGFHIYDRDLGKKFNNDLKLMTEFVTKLKEEITDFIDLKIYDYRRILKIPYSLAVYEDCGEWRLFKVSKIPLEELKEFDYKKYEIT